MKYAAITSMNDSYYDHCGRTMLRTYKTHWSDAIPMFVYNEDNFHIKVNNINSMGWDLGDEYNKFQDRQSNARVKTFSKKAFSIIHAMDNIQVERIIWIDADVILTNDINIQLLDLVSPDNVLSTHFSVWHEKDNITYHSCETGFFILNTTHPGYKDFCDTYKDIYFNDNTEGLRRFYDGEVYGKTVEIMSKQGHKMINLNPGKHKTPISRSVLAPYLTHYKASLKETADFKKIDSALEDEI
jgi:hypothetical protein